MTDERAQVRLSEEARERFENKLRWHFNVAAEEGKGSVYISLGIENAVSDVEAILTERLAGVWALADEWEATVYKLPPGYPMTVNEFCRIWFKAPLRAALTAATETPASAE